MKILNYLPFFYLLVFFSLLSADNVTIERYQPERDGAAIKKIIQDNYEFLAYESLGFPEGTTHKYLQNSEYITDVLHVNGQIVGFINYAAYNITFLTFHMGVSFIHLIGIDEPFRRRGYGLKLLQHADAELKKLKAPLQIEIKRNNQKNYESLYEKECYIFPDLFQKETWIHVLKNYDYEK